MLQLEVHKAPKTARKHVKNCWHNFAVFRYLTGPLVAISVHILVHKVIIFDLSGITSKSRQELSSEMREM